MKKVKLLLFGVSALVIVGIALAFKAPATLGGALRCITFDPSDPPPLITCPDASRYICGGGELTGYCAASSAPANALCDFLCTDLGMNI